MAGNHVFQSLVANEKRVGGGIRVGNTSFKNHSHKNRVEMLYRFYDLTFRLDPHEGTMDISVDEGVAAKRMRVFENKRNLAHEPCDLRTVLTAALHAQCSYAERSAHRGTPIAGLGAGGPRLKKKNRTLAGKNSTLVRNSRGNFGVLAFTVTPSGDACLEQGT
jgi:hypothetical protein